MRTIEESIALLEQWREDAPDIRSYSIRSAANRTHVGVIIFPSVLLWPSSDVFVRATLVEALDKAASEVSK